MLDVLFVLYRNAQRDLTVDEVAAAAFTVPSAARTRLDELMDRALARRVGSSGDSYQLGVLSPVRQLILKEIHDSYARNRVAVAKIIFSRADALDAFANAFRLRKGPS